MRQTSLPKAPAVVLGILFALMHTSVSAGETSVIHGDPRGDAAPDVWRTSKVVKDRTPDRIRFRVYGYFWPDWEIGVRVDSRGGPRADYRLWNYESLGLSRCGGTRISDGAPIRLRCARMVPMLEDGTLSWSIPSVELERDKRVRWRVHAHYPGATDDEDDDFAPDPGWYS